MGFFFFFFIKEKVADGNISLKKGRKDNCDYEHGVGSMPKLHSVAFLFFSTLRCVTLIRRDLLGIEIRCNTSITPNAIIMNGREGGCLIAMQLSIVIVLNFNPSCSKLAV